jgi:hypothetical protein
MFIRIRLPVGKEKKALLVPEEALASKQGQKVVYVVRRVEATDDKGNPVLDDEHNPKMVDKAFEVAVEPGQLETDNWRVIKRSGRSGQELKPGDRIVVSGLQRVRDKGDVRVPEYWSSLSHDEPTPPQLSDAVSKSLEPRAIRIQDRHAEAIADVWLAKEPAVKATAEQVKNGLDYSELPAATLLGAIRIVKTMKDHAGMEVAPGVYTLRLGTTSVPDPKNKDKVKLKEIALLCPADDDRTTNHLDAEAVENLSKKATGKEQPGGFILAHASRDANDSPRLLGKQPARPGEPMKWVLFVKLPVKAGEEKGKLPFGLTLIVDPPRH